MSGNANSGRVSQPAKVLQLKGRGPGKDSAGRPIKQPPKFNRVPPEPPPWMSDEAQAEWGRVAPGLTVLDLLKAEDRAILTAYCETWATFKESVRYVREHGLTHLNVTTRADGAVTERLVAHPVVSVMHTAGRELRAFAAQFGLSPAAEMTLGRVGGSGDEGDGNPFDGSE